MGADDSKQDFKVRHTVIVRFKEGHRYSDPVQAKEIVQACLDLNQNVGKDLDGRMALTCGLDLGLPGQLKEKGQASMAIVADFVSQEDYLKYGPHPAHQEFVKKYMVPELEII